MFCMEKSARKNFFLHGDFRPLPNKKCSNVRPLLSITVPQEFQISKNIEHPTSGSGGKKTVKRYLKSEQTNTQTDGQTHRQTDISTYKKDWPRGPMLWKCWVIKTTRKKDGPNITNQSERLDLDGQINPKLYEILSKDWTLNLFRGFLKQKK